MARLPRIVVPGVAHHVTQRGNRRQRIFHGDANYALYLDLLAERCRHNEVCVWSNCLMPNHVHLIMTPATAEGLSRAVGEAHRRYTAYINANRRATAEFKPLLLYYESSVIPHSWDSTKNAFRYRSSIK